MKKPGFRWMSPDKIRALMNVAQGLEKADLVVTNGDLVNVYTGEIQRNYSVAVKHDRVAWVGTNPNHTIGPNTRVIDATGKTIIPGLIDSHTHMLSVNYPPETIKYATVHGATTIITETQEVAFPLGVRGARYFMNYLINQPIKFFFTAAPLVTLGKDAEPHFFREKEMAWMLRHDRVVGLGETYWLPVIKGEQRIMDLFAQTLSAGKRLEGHAAGARNDKLVSYFASGVTSCHESTTMEEAIEKLRLGVNNMIREGQVRRELPAIGKIQELNIDFRLLSLVSDGASANILLEKGYMDHIVEEAIRNGLKPVTAIQAATLNPAAHFGLDDFIGGIAPARFADILVVPAIDHIRPDVVISNGKVVAESGTLLEESPAKKWPRSLMQSLHFPRRFTAADFAIPAPVSEGSVKARIIDDVTELVTKELIAEVDVSGGLLRPDAGKDIIKVATINRVQYPGKVAVGLLKGFGMTRGAFSSSGGWDCGSIVLVGASDEDMALAANRLADLYGGAVVCADGKVLAELPMPLGGVMSTLSMVDLRTRQREVQSAVAGLGCRFPRAHLALDVLTSPAIPHLRMSDVGVFNVRDNRPVDVVVA